MTKFIENQYERIQWFILIAGLIVFFFFKDYIIIIILLYLIVRAIKHREKIKDSLAKMSMKEKWVRSVGFIILIVLLTAIMMNTLGPLDAFGVPTWLLYVYIFLVINIISIGYAYIVKRIMKIMQFRKSE
jgi:uncharacterized protein YacL